MQVASLGALASEVTALYGLRQHKVIPAKSAAVAAAAPTPVTLAAKDDVSAQDVKMTFEQFYALRDQAMSGRLTRALEGGLAPGFAGDWTQFADAPSIWPVEGRVGSSFGEREDPINGEGAFHPGIDIEASYGTPVRAAGDGDVTGENMGAGYGRQVVLDHGHDLITLYGHLSAVAVCPASTCCAVRSSGTSANPAVPRARTCTMKCASTRFPSIRTSICAPPTSRPSPTALLRTSQASSNIES